MTQENKHINKKEIPKQNNNNNNNNAVINELKTIYQLMCDEKLVYLQIEEENKKIHLKRFGPEEQVVIHQTKHSAQFEKQHRRKEDKILDNANHISIKSPLIGVFYRSPSPTSAPFVEVGQIVDLGETLCIIEAMKSMNEITANIKCKIVKILIENGHTVASGQEIFIVEPI